MHRTVYHDLKNAQPQQLSNQLKRMNIFQINIGQNIVFMHKEIEQ